MKRGRQIERGGAGSMLREKERAGERERVERK